MAIHPTASVDPGAELGDVEIGPFAVVGPGVILHDGVSMGPHAVVQGPTVVGQGSSIDAHAVLGGAPQDLKHDGSPTRLEIGRNNVFREYATAHRGSSAGRGVTVIGDDNYFMASSHVAHDCVVGDGCMFANSAAIAGHVEVGDGVMLGGLAGMHQFTRIGRLAMLAGGGIATQDVPPFALAQGDRARQFGLNVIGLKRAGFDGDTLSALKAAWRTLFVSGLAMRTAMARVRSELGEVDEVAELLGFLASSTRGVCRAASAGRSG